MTHPKRIENLEQYFINTEIMKALAAQVAKDLKLDPFEISLNEGDPSPYHQIQSLVLPVINELLRGQAQKLQQCIYQIDLAESVYKRSLQAEDPASALTDEIMKRLLQKVVIRKLYST
jgi:hypothetical protein